MATAQPLAPARRARAAGARRGRDRRQERAATATSRVGDRTTVLVQGPPQRVRIVGIIGFGTADSPAGRPWCCSPRRSRRSWSRRPGKFTRSCSSPSRASRSSSSSATCSGRCRTALEAVTGATVIKETRTASPKALSFFNTFLLIFAVVALLVGAFMIFNTFSITVAQRTRENGLLRALGASKRQVLGSVLAEARGGRHHRVGHRAGRRRRRRRRASRRCSPRSASASRPAGWSSPRGRSSSSLAWPASSSPWSRPSRPPARPPRCRPSRPCRR